MTFEEIIAKAQELQDEQNAIPAITSISTARSALGVYRQILNDTLVLIREDAERGMELRIRLAALEIYVTTLLPPKLPNPGSFNG